MGCYAIPDHRRGVRRGHTGGRQRGVTLIELVVVVLIIGILASIAYPTYTRHVDNTRRSDGQVALLETAQRLQRCFTVENDYEACDDRIPDESPDGYYTISSPTLETSRYTLQASPTGVHANDRCANLTLTHAGVRGSSADDPEDCW